MLTLALWGCTPDEPATTYQADIRPLLERRCVSCHTDGNIAPFALTTAAEVTSVREMAVDAVLDRRMPPWDQDPDCRPSRDSQWLADEELAVFEAWRAGGFVEGDEADYIAPPIEHRDPLPPPDLELVPAQPYTPVTTRTDDYRCQILTAPLTEDLFVTGVAVAPDQIAMAHHAILYAIASTGADRIAQLEAEDPEPGYTCFGDPGIEDSQTLGGWVPGRETTILQGGIAQRVPAGSTFVLQMHYNTAAVETVLPDASVTQVWTLPPGELPTQLLTVFPVAKTGLFIPAGDAAWEQVSMQRIPTNAQIVGTAPHMHLLGQRLQTKLIRPDGSEECLSDVAYDFDWQRSYPFALDSWVPLSPDDRFEITCTYDNSAENQPMEDGVPRTPTDVTWGDGTFDEMCLDYMSLLSPYGGTGTGEICDGVAPCRADCATDDPACTMACMMTAGDPCLYCGLENAFSGCTIDACVAEALPVGICMDTCAEDREHYIDCMLGECAEQVSTFWTCREAAISAGDCPPDGATCPGL